MLGFNRKAKKTTVKQFDTGRRSARNKAVAHAEASRQSKLYKRGATGS